MTEPRLHSVQCLGARGLHRMAYAEWGDPANPRVLVCAHGLARQGRDFDTFAQAMSDRYRVVCPDVVGRGRSDWLADPSGYQIPAYVADMVTLRARLDAAELHWVGTSMGGLIGMAVAGTVLKDRISHLVLNDVGPAIAPGAVSRILTYAGTPPAFATLPELEQYFRTIYAPFGIASDAGWRKLAETSARRLPDGRLTPHYDPQIAAVLGRQATAVTGDAWPLYDQIAAKTLLLRGAVSDLLSDETAAEMTRRGPKARRIDMPGIGHAPALDTPAQIALIMGFLAE